MINPIMATSARRRMRSLKTPIILTLYSGLLLAFVYLYTFEAYGKATFTIYQMRRGVEGYIFLLALQFVLLVLVAPAMTAGSISGERERQTLDLLRVTNTSSFSIAMGKLMESFGFLCLLILSSMPMLSLILLTGGVTFGQIMMSTLHLILVALAALSVGLFCSAIFKRTVTATVVSYLAVFAIGVLTLIPLIWDVQKIGDIYTSARDNGITLENIVYVPVSFVLNPGLGLLALVAEQTDLLKSTMSQMSYTISVTFDLLDFGAYATYNMIFLAGMSVLLTGLSALRVRVRRGTKNRRGRKKG